MDILPYKTFQAGIITRKKGTDILFEKIKKFLKKVLTFKNECGNIIKLSLEAALNIEK